MFNSPLLNYSRINLVLGSINKKRKLHLEDALTHFPFFIDLPHSSGECTISCFNILAPQVKLQCSLQVMHQIILTFQSTETFGIKCFLFQSISIIYACQNSYLYSGRVGWRTGPVIFHLLLPSCLCLSLRRMLNTVYREKQNGGMTAKRMHCLILLRIFPLSSQIPSKNLFSGVQMVAVVEDMK